MATGTVSIYSHGRGSGWIRPDSGGDMVYVHKSGIVRADEGIAPRLEKGQRVEFQIGQRPRGNAAVNVRPLEESDEVAPATDGADVAAPAEATAV